MKNTLIQINKNGMGGHDASLALVLMPKYFQLISEEPNTPAFIVFYNEGVKLLCKNSPCIEQLKSLESKGTQLIACSTCLNFLELTEKLCIGKKGSMQDIIELQKKAEKIITL